MLTCYCAVEHNSFITQSGFELLASGSVFEQTDSENRAQPQYLYSCQLCDVITVSLLATSVFEVPPGTSADLSAPEHSLHAWQTGLQWSVCLHGGRRCVLEHVTTFLCASLKLEWICVVSLNLHVIVELNGAKPSWCIWSSFKEV